MKEYLKIHAMWFFALFFSVGLFVFLVWLDGYRNAFVLSYGLLLLLLLNSVLLGVDFYLNRGFYQYLKSGNGIRSQGYLARKCQKQLDNDYQQMQQQLADIEQHHQTHIKFMNIWVHQMKTPVSVLELMAESEPIDSYDLLAETDRLKSGLATALNFVRLEDFTEDFLIEEISLLSIVKRSIGEQKRNFIRHEVYPKIENEADFLVTTDKKWLGILLYQLISNAIKYSPSQAITLFELNATKRQLTVTDFGCGIPTDDLPRIFRPFFTGTNGRVTGEATGMGLYLVALIAEQLDIDIQLSSTVGEGTKVTLTFIEK